MRRAGGLADAGGKDRQRYTKGAFLGAMRGGSGGQKELETALVYGDPRSSKVMTASKLKPAQVRIDVFRVL